MTYLPQHLISNDFIYTISNDSILVRTNQNCYTQYNSTYCNCYQVYPKLDYLVSQPYSCSVSNVTGNLSPSNFTSDIYYRLDLSNIFIIFLTLFLFIYLIPFRLFGRLFGRWLKL